MGTSSETASRQPFFRRPRQRLKRRIRERIHGADVDFTQDVGILPGSSPGAVEEIGIPEERERAGFDCECLAEGIQPLVFHLLFNGLIVECRGWIVKPRTGLGSISGSAA